MKKFVAKRNVNDNSVKVGSNRTFSEANWREAILYFLNGVWANNEEVMCLPTITFSGVTLSLKDPTKEYHCFVQPMMCTSIDKEAREKKIQLHDGDILEVGADQNSVEIGLIRFVRDDSIGCLKISFEHGAKSFLSLHKTTKRGEYLTDGENLGHLAPRRG